jgi:hypothetical protein
MPAERFQPRDHSGHRSLDGVLVGGRGDEWKVTVTQHYITMLAGSLRLNTANEDVITASKSIENTSRAALDDLQRLLLVPHWRC